MPSDLRQSARVVRMKSLRVVRRESAALSNAAAKDFGVFTWTKYSNERLHHQFEGDRRMGRRRRSHKHNLC